MPLSTTPTLPVLPLVTAVIELPVPGFDTELIRQLEVIRTGAPEQTVIAPVPPPATAVPPAVTGVATVRLARFGAALIVTLKAEDAALSQPVVLLRQITETPPLNVEPLVAVEMVYVFELEIRPWLAPVREPVTVTTADTDDGQPVVILRILGFAEDDSQTVTVVPL